MWLVATQQPGLACCLKQQYMGQCEAQKTWPEGATEMSMVPTLLYPHPPWPMIPTPQGPEAQGHDPQWAQAIVPPLPTTAPINYTLTDNSDYSSKVRRPDCQAHSYPLVASISQGQVRGIPTPSQPVHIAGPERPGAKKRWIQKLTCAVIKPARARLQK